MITYSSREIIRNAQNSSNSTNASLLDFNMATNILNTEYRKLYSEIVTNSLDFVSEITTANVKTLLPPDCFVVLSVTARDGNILSRAGIQSTHIGGYYIENGVLVIPGASGEYKVKYSKIPDTLTAPEKAITFDAAEIPTDKKKYYCDYSNGLVTFTENKSNKYLGKVFDYDLAVEQENPIWRFDDTLYNADLTEGEEPAGEALEPVVIGNVHTLTDSITDSYVKTKPTTTTVTFTDDAGHYYKNDFTAEPKPAGTLTNRQETVGYLKVFHNPTAFNLYEVDSNFYTSTLQEETEPSYTTKSDGAIIGVVRKNSTTLYQKEESDWYEVTGFSTSAIYHANSPISDASVIAALEAADDLNVVYYAYTQGTVINGWIKAVPSTIPGQPDFYTYESVTSFTDSEPVTISDEFDVAYLQSLTFTIYYAETYVDYASYHATIGLSKANIVYAEDPISDVDTITALDATDEVPVYYIGYIEAIDQKFIWDETDIYDLIAREGALVVNIQMHSPYMMISYSDGLILIYTGWKKAIWNYNCIFGHETLGEIIALKTDDTTGKGCVWHNWDDDQYYYCSFVPDTILNYPTSALFDLMIYRIAARFNALLGQDDDYLNKTLIPQAEIDFYRTLSFGRVASRINHKSPSFRIIGWT